MKVIVSNAKGRINVPAKVPCTIGGKSIPVKIEAIDIPFDTLTVSLKKIPFEKGSFDPSESLNEPPVAALIN